MSWLSLGLALLKLANLILGLVKDQQLMDAGVDRQIAETSAAILKRTQAGKEVVAKVTAMTEAQVDEALKELEPK